MPVSESLPSRLRHKYLNNGLSQRLITRGASACIGLGTLFGGTSSSFADIIPDGSTSSSFSNSISTCGFTTPCISGGDRRGNNLFHSFEEFTIDAGERVFLGRFGIFPNPQNIDRIFIRVVDLPTEIRGTLEAVNLLGIPYDVVFLSPKGITIGDGAEISYPGSFLFSTAERLDFGGGATFDATNSNPLLTLSGFENLPSALRLGSAPGEISFGNSSLSLREEINIPQTHQHQFAIVGDKINFNNVEISTPGALTILSANENQIIGLTPLSSGIIFNYSPSIDAEDINLDNSLLSINSLSSSNNAEIIEIIGKNLNLAQSQIQTETDLRGGNIAFDLTGALSLTDQSEITTQAADPLASAGNITIAADSLSLFDQNKIETGSNSTDGNIELTIAGNVSLENASQISTVSSDPTTSGSNITLDAAGRVLLFDQSIISTKPGADVANLGLIDITAASLDLIQQSEISTVSGGITVNSDQIQLERSSEIKSSTNTSGGNIDLNASGLVDLNTFSTITTQATAPTASAGNITISSDSLRLLDQNKIETSSNSTNGDINLTMTGDVLVEDSRISTLSGTTATSGSNITLKANGSTITLKDQSSISTQPNASAAGFGDISIDSDQLNINNQSDTSTTAGEISINSFSKTRLVQNSSITSSTGTDGGNITIAVDNGSVELDDQSRISTQTTALTADAGDITLTSEGLGVLNQSQISTRTGSGGRGDIALNITAEATLGNQSIISTETATSTADAGNISLTSTGLDLLDQSQISTTTNAAGGGITLFEIGDFEIDNSQITTTALNASAIAGDINIDATSLDVRNSGKVLSGSSNFDSGDITITLGNSLNISNNGEIATVADSFLNPVTDASAGNIVLSGNSLAIQDSGKIYSLTGDTGGDITLDFNSGSISLSNTVANTDNFIATRAVGTGNAGTLTLTAGNLSLSDQSQILSETGQSGGDLNFILGEDLTLNTGSSIAPKAREGSGGSAGVLDLSGRNLTIDGENSLVFSLTENGGGDLDLNLTNDIALSNGAQLGAFLTSNGDTINGDAGSILLQALNLSLNNDADIITETADGRGNIDIDLAGDLAVLGGTLGSSEIIAKLSTTQGAAGNISIAANDVTFDQGYLLTETDQPGGNINVNATNAIQFEQSLIRLSSPTGTGHTGNLSLASQSTSAPIGISLIKTEVFNEATNTGGDVVFTAQGEVEMRDGSYISIDSSGANGNLTVAASAFRSNAIDADNNVLLSQGTLNNLSLPAEVTGFDPLADQVVPMNANSELLPNPFPPPVAPPPPVTPPETVTPPSPTVPPEPQPTPVIPSQPEPQAPVFPVVAPLNNNPIVDPLETPANNPTPPETSNNAPPPYSEFRSISSQTENFLTVTDLLAFYGAGQASLNGFRPRSCFASSPSRFHISGRGGIGLTPSSLSGGNQSLADLGQVDGSEVSDNSVNAPDTMIQAASLSSRRREAQAWQQNVNGSIELVAQADLVLDQPRMQGCDTLR